MGSNGDGVDGTATRGGGGSDAATTTAAAVATTAAAATATAAEAEAAATSSAPAVVVDLTKDLWQNILLNVRDSVAAEATEMNLLIVGASGAGKTTLLQRLTATTGSSGRSTTSSMSTSRKLKPTTALEYSFMRRNVNAAAASSSLSTQQQQQQQQVVHFWELAHGMQMAQLSEVVLTPEAVHTACVAVVVDAAPRGLSVAWQVATYWLRRVEQRVGEVMQKMRAKNSSTPDKLLARARRGIGATHPDLPRMRLSGVPTVLVVNKMDAFTGDTTRLRTVVRAFRFLAHVYGAYVIFTSEQDAHRWRALMLHVLFQAPFDARHVQFDAERGAVLLTPDKESFADIGDAGVAAKTSSSGGSGAATADVELDRWRVLFDATFPPTLLTCEDGDAGDGDDAALSSSRQKQQRQSSSSSSSTQQQSSDDAFLRRLYDLGEDGYGEPTIDALRRQMDDELEQYKRTAKQREAKA